MNVIVEVPHIEVTPDNFIISLIIFRLLKQHILTIAINVCSLDLVHFLISIHSRIGHYIQAIHFDLIFFATDP